MHALLLNYLVVEHRVRREYVHPPPSSVCPGGVEGEVGLKPLAQAEEPMEIRLEF